MLQASLPVEVLSDRLCPHDAYRLFPPAADRAAWDALAQNDLQARRFACLQEEVSSRAVEPWPQLLASEYMSFARDGNRSRYQDIYFGRRARLAQAVVAECWDYRGRWLDSICDGIWLILGEPTWCIPAHARRRDADPLPYAGGIEVDLFGCDTGMLLAMILQLLGPELRRHSPSLVERVETAVETRIIRQVEECGDEIWWFSGRNNWTPWCASNVLCAALVILPDRARCARLIDILNQTIDRFIAFYGDDGGCDEGPMYWGKAAGALYDYLARLEAALPEPLAVFAHPKIRAMAEFYCTAQLHQDWVLNFADAPGKGKGAPPLVHAFGKRVGSTIMQDLAVASARNFRADAEFPERVLPASGIGTIMNGLSWLFEFPTSAPPVNLRKPLSAWLPDLQVAVLRQDPHTDRGLILGAKGGHNAESHNHNDIGHYIVMLDGQPGIIDIGTAIYERKTFSSERYSLWYIRGAAHNAPVINGVEQQAGRDFAARDLSFHDEDGVATLSMDLAGAYPAEARVAALRRVFVFDRGAGCITVTDTVRLTDPDGELVYHLYSQAPARVNGQTLHLATSPRPMLLTVSGADAPRVEAVPIEDAQLRQVWGETLQHLSFTSRSGAAATEIRVQLVIQAGATP